MGFVRAAEPPEQTPNHRVPPLPHRGRGGEGVRVLGRCAGATLSDCFFWLKFYNQLAAESFCFSSESSKERGGILYVFMFLCEPLNEPPETPSHAVARR
jgi:hypothetical protein